MAKDEFRKEKKPHLKREEPEPVKLKGVEIQEVVQEAVAETAAVPEIAAPEAAVVPEVAAPAFSRKPRPTDSGLVEKVVSINRVAKTTKGGTRLSFSALVVVGDGKGKVGYALGKAGEVAGAIKKALNSAKKTMVKIPMRGKTITHEILGECGSAKVLLKPASDGTGVIAAGPVRAICDGAGITNILSKCHRSNNPINVVKATFDGLTRLKTLEETVQSSESQ